MAAERPRFTVTPSGMSLPVHIPRFLSRTLIGKLNLKMPEKFIKTNKIKRNFYLLVLAVMVMFALPLRLTGSGEISTVLTSTGYS